MVRAIWNSRRLFVPLLAGASLRDRVIASIGAVVGIGFVGLVCTVLFPSSVPWIVAPMGASAVLLFAVPTSPLAQPWSIVGGNGVSAAVGVVCAEFIPDAAAAAALAVAAAILAMSFLRCLHPPGGAAALSAVIGGYYLFSDYMIHFLIAVAVNSLLLAAIGWVFHRFSGHSYPHRPQPVEGKAVSSPQAPGLLLNDIDKALDDLGETFDISREDLALLLERAEFHAAARNGPTR